MTRKAFLQKYFVRFAVSLTLVALIVYTVYHVFSSSSGSLMTTPTRTITDRQILRGEAFLFRDEEVLTVSEAGLVNGLVESGTKISRGVAIAEVWGNESSKEALAESQLRLDRLNRMISVLEKSDLPENTTLSKAEAFRLEALSNDLAIRRAVAAGDWTLVSSLEDDMLIALNRYASLTDPEATLSEVLSGLKRERSALLKGSCTTVNNTQASGYFYDRSFVDGHEGSFDTAALESLTAESFAELTSLESAVGASGYAVGKMVYGYDWYIGISFDGADGLFEEGYAYTVSFPENRDRELRMVCERLIVGADGKTVVIFTSDEVPSDFCFLRRQDIEITVGSCTGYYIPEAALQTVNGIEGVYIFKDSTVYFRRVDILYRGDGYVIAAEQGERGDDYLALYDILITSGKDLYDGRVYE